MRKIFALSLALALCLTACGAPSPAEPLHVFAAASLTESLDAVIARYEERSGVEVVPTYDSSGTLKTQIQEGAVCDLFLSAAQKQMDALDGALASDPEKNPDGLDLIDSATRRDLLENKVTLAVPADNPKGVDSFDVLAERLQAGDVLLAMGNSDVPVGQYTLKIFDYYGLSEEALRSAGVLTYGSNVKEVTMQISEGAVDCGVIYATDAFSEGLTVVDSATAEMCGQVVYPAAVLKNSAQPDAAQAFLDYLSSPEAAECFEAVGFTPVS